MPEHWLDQMFDPCGVYEAVWEHGEIVDFERTFLNASGRVALQLQGGDERVTSMRRSAPNLVESGLFARYVEVARTGIPWTGISQTYADVIRTGVYDIQAWRVEGGIAVTWRDVSDQIALQAELAASEQRFRATIEQLPDAVSVFESVRDTGGDIVDFRWTYANTYNAEMTGFTVDDLVGSRLLEVFPEQGPAGMLDVYRSVVETGESWEQPTVWYEDTWGDGTRRRRAFDVRASKVGDGFVVVSRDVTELRLASDALADLSEELGESNTKLAARNRTLHDLIDVVGHDVGNPAGAARGFLELAADACREEDWARVPDLIQRATRSGRRVEQLLANVLAMARNDLQDLVAQSEPVAVEPLVKLALADLGGDHDTTVRVAPGLVVLADPSQLRTVLGNLVTNAHRHGAPPVTVEAHADGEQVLITVTDAGPGVDPEFAPRLFDRFSRGGTTAPGTGLGLYLARLMCRAAGGDLHHEPGAGGADRPGARFVVSLPRGA